MSRARRGNGSPKTQSAGDVERTYRVIEDAVLGLWNVVDDLSKVRPPIPRYYRVTIFGSARIQPGDKIYDDVRRLAAELAGMGCDIVTGGGPGLMQAANEGERLGDVHRRTRSFGIRVDLSFEQAVNPFVDRLYKHRSFFSRLHHFVRLSSAFVVMEGGIGTSLELMMIWQLLQVSQLHGTPLLLVGPMWKELVDWAGRHMVTRQRQLASPSDLAIPTCVDTVDEAIQIIREAHAAWLNAKPTRSEARGTRNG